MDEPVMTLAFPPTITDGAFVMVEQDSQADIDGSVEVVARCPRGHINSLPGMGIRDYVLTRGAPNPREVLEGIRPYEPRVDIASTSTLTNLVATITIGAEASNGR